MTLLLYNTALRHETGCKPSAVHLVGGDADVLEDKGAVDEEQVVRVR